MKKITLITLLIIGLFAISTCYCVAQTIVTKQGTVLTQVAGPAATFESLTKNATLTELTFNNKAGESYPVYVSVNGKYFYCKQSKSGNWYKNYITIQ
jgi:hypothetical protein